MGKPDHDSTMDISVSQLVPDAPRRPVPPAPRPPADKHDASYFKQIVVGTEDFAPPARASRAPWLVIGGAAAIAVAAGVAIYLAR